MRLLDIDSLQFSEFPRGAVPPYAIASHRWGEGEPTYQTFPAEKDAKFKTKGVAKVMAFCKAVKSWSADIRWLWIDTCCVDKTNSVELSEIINSMYRYYLEAEICFAYLMDVRPISHGSSVVLEDFRKSVWFKRGWTLQELIAPRTIAFLSQDWKVIGHKGLLHDSPTATRLNNEITSITNIGPEVLNDASECLNLSIETRLDWMANRQTTILEDSTYCLLGIFGIFMPLIYGEGRAAQKRLMLELNRQMYATIMPIVMTKIDLKSADKSERDIVLKWISQFNPQDHHEDVRNRQPLAKQSTQWLFDSEEAISVTFRQWRDETGPACQHRMLWAYGHPAIGKTTVASQIVDHLQRLPISPDPNGVKRRIGVSWAYINMVQNAKAASSDKLPLPGLVLRSLIQALLQQLHEVPDHVRRLHEVLTSPRRVSASDAQLLQCLKDLCEYAFVRTYLIVDGLDEASEQDGRDVVSYLKRLPSNTKVMITSRFLESIRDAVETPLHIQIQTHRQDAQLFFDLQCGRNAAFATLVQSLETAEPGAKALLAEAIMKRATFSFLNAQLCMNMLLKARTPHALKQAGLDLPLAPKEVYQTLIRRLKSKWEVPDRQWSKKILTWICFGGWTLSPRELLYIIGLDLDNPDLDHDNILTPSTLITSVCDGLVSVHAAAQKVSMVHVDALQFFQNKEHEEVFFPDAHLDIAEMCIAHFKASSRLGYLVGDHELGGFTYNAMRRFPNHVRTHAARIQPGRKLPARSLTSDSITSSASRRKPEAPERALDPGSTMLFQHIIGVLEDELYLEFISFLLVKNGLWRGSEDLWEWSEATKLHVAAALGLCDATKYFATDHQLINKQDSRGWTALNVAIELKFLDVAEVLIQAGTKVDLGSDTGQVVFAMAVARGELAFARKMLEPAEDKSPGHHHFRARGKGRSNKTVRLLAAALDNDARSIDGTVLTPLFGKSHAAKTALLVSADCGHLKVLQKLLDAGVPVNHKDAEDRTALHRAAQRNDVSMVELLVRYKADVNATAKDGFTPWTEILLLPDHEQVERILISHSANVNAATLDGSSPLYMAASGGHIDMVKKLLEAGADPSIRTDFLWTPLVGQNVVVSGIADSLQHWASHNGNFDVASALIEYNADVNAVADTGETPLQKTLAGNGHWIYMRANLFINHPISSSTAFAKGNIHPQHSPETCNNCEAQIDSEEMAFACSVCTQTLCCSCFLHPSWCLDPTHKLGSTWIVKRDTGEAPTITLATSMGDRDSLKEGSVAALLRRHGALTTDEVRRSYERSLNLSISPWSFKQLAAQQEINSIGQKIHERWYPYLAGLDVDQGDEDDEFDDEETLYSSQADTVAGAKSSQSSSSSLAYRHRDWSSMGEEVKAKGRRFREKLFKR